jgi:hypothetical protein
MIEGTGVRFPGGARYSFLSQNVRSALGHTQSSLQSGRRELPSGHEVDHVPTSRAEVNAWSCTSTFPYAWMAFCLIKHKDCFTFSRRRESRWMKK